MHQNAIEMLKILVIILISVPVLTIFLATYLTHLSMTRDQAKKDHNPLKYIDFFSLLKVMQRFLKEDRLSGLEGYKGSLTFKFTKEELFKHYLHIFQGEKNLSYSIYEREDRFFTWHADILVICGKSYFLDPISLYLMYLYIALIFPKNLKDYDRYKDNIEAINLASKDALEKALDRLHS